ncbi:DUF1440 domain-containing protein [Eupransor demetentiae]|uniref:DUF1440 family (YagU) n=1 Tax=Eupransor demetentiae TaxID=3109584 RepID=A0ABM9N6L0_9LACO|nr:DUF1440 family (YagU) [Lactobacillaceae bacterium LMG 33000]
MLANIIFNSIWVGFVAGMISGMVKIGWEAIFPPRNQERNATNPPQKLLEQLGVPASVTHATITVSDDQKLPYVALIMHFGFSVAFSMLFVFLANYYADVTYGQGVVYGLVIWVAFHWIILPACKTIPAAWKQPWYENLSEFLGHAIWGWTIYIVAIGLPVSGVYF